jgi:hypothetical protein
MITDAFDGVELLDVHVSDQGEPWVNLSGELGLDGSGLTTTLAGAGKYYLDDPAYGSATPGRVDLALGLPVTPVPDEAFDIWLFVFGVGADGDSVNFLAIQLECPPSHVYKVSTLSVDALGVDDFTAWANLAGPPSVISIDPQAQKFYVDDVLVATLGNAPTWGADSRVGVKMDFVTGVNIHATGLTAAASASGSAGEQSAKKMSISHSAGLGTNRSGATR